MHELSVLAEKDPEFYKYLQENDRELLEFDPGVAGAAADSDEDEDGGFDMDTRDGDAMEEDTLPVLTKDMLTKWQKAILEVSSVSYNVVSAYLSSFKFYLPCQN